MVATDRSPSASRAVDWAARMAESFGAELWLLQVLVPEATPGTEAGQAEATRAGYAQEELQQIAREIAGARGRAYVAVDTDPARATVTAAHEEGVDVLVVGNLGMTGRKEFLLGNVPNRVSHNARCTVVIVNTAVGGTDGFTPHAPGAPGPETDGEDRVEGHLLGRATTITTILAKHGLRELFSRS